MTGRRALLVLAFVLMAAPLLCALVTFAARSEAAGPWLEPAKAGTSCVLPPATVRYEHMNHLRRLRDQVVRDGARSALGGSRPSGMASCRGCHAHRERFCDRCHERASVQPDCFRCHSY